MPPQRAPSSKSKESPTDPTAFTSFPDFSKINDECFNGGKEDTFSTPRPPSGAGTSRIGATTPGAEKRWGVVDNVSIKDLMWLCDQTFAKTARQICTEVLQSVQGEFEAAKAQMRHDVVQPINALTNALDRLPSRLDGPIKRIIEAEVMPSLVSFGQSVKRMDEELKASFGQVEKQGVQVEELQRRSVKTCEQLLDHYAVNTQDQLAQLRQMQNQLLDGKKSTAGDIHQLLQASHDLHGVIEQKVDALLWKHTKEYAVKVDFGEMPRGLGEEDMATMSACAEVMHKVDGTLAEFDEKMQVWLMESMQAYKVSTQENVRGAEVESQSVAIQCEPIQVADAMVQAAGEAPVRKKRPRPTRATQRASRVSLAVEVKDKVAKRGVPVFADVGEMKRNVRMAMMKQRYNVHDLYHTSGCSQAIARHPYFENAVLGVIFLNAIWLSIDIDNNSAAVLVDASPIFIVMENIFCTFFTGELLIRFFAFERKSNCCKDFWFVFDCVVNIYMIGETWILSLVLLLSVDVTATEAVFDASALRIIRMVKILRLSRMAKLLRAIPELSIVIKAIGAAGRSMLVIAVFCVMVIYVFALTLKQITLIVNTDPSNAVLASDFNSVLSAMNTLLLRSLFSDSAELVNDLASWHPVFWPCIMLFVLITSVTMMYMLMGVMVNVIDIVAASEREGLAVSTVALNLRQVMKRLGISTEGPISKSCLNDLLNEAEVVNFLYSVDVDVISLLDSVDQIFEDVLEREGRPLQFGDLVETIMNMRGSNPATVQDLKGSFKSLKVAFNLEMQQLRQSLHGQLHSITQQLRDDHESGSEEYE